jgi:sugar-specific transcriptional regulator TrmB
MSQEKVLKTLRDLGLTRLDSKVYIYLSKKGPHKGKDISIALKIQKQQLYRSLKKLQSKAVVSCTIEHPARFSAVPFESVLDLFIKAKLEEAQVIQQEKSELVSSWKAIQSAALPDVSARFMVIEGRNIVYSRIRQMIDATKHRLSIISTVQGLVRVDQFGLLDKGFKHPLQSRLKFRLLTHLSKDNVDAMQNLLEETPKKEMFFEIRNPNLASNLFPRMAIRDDEEAVFFINPNVEEALSEPDDLCLWTDCKSLIHSFLSMFDELWRNSTDVERKVKQIKTGKPVPKSYLLSEPELIRKKYEEVLQSSMDEIVLLTSSKGLVLASKDATQFKSLRKRGVSIKVMAPLEKRNWEAMKQLSAICEIRHASANYLETIIVDNEHLFQLKAPYPGQADFNLTPYFVNSYYTDNREWVARTKIALDDIWKNALVPSEVTLESLGAPFRYPVFPLPKDDLRTQINFDVIDLKPPGTLTEKEVISKIINGERVVCKDLSKDPSKLYGSSAMSVIHPPSAYNLPEMILQVWKVEKNSSFGEENFMTVYLQIETSIGLKFVPVAILGNNPKAAPIRRIINAGNPAGRNMHFCEKDELEVSVRGNTLFAGWTVPIPLCPPKYVLPPSCLIIEGHGNVKSLGYTMIMPSGFKLVTENNAFDAFVTLIHPVSKYSGPSTDGILVRDTIMTIIPP